nr:MAG TPA: YopX protein [Caudoviricetes sp.]
MTMREIKFRALLKADGRIYEVRSVDFLNKEATLWDKETAVNFEVSFKDIELLQFAGFKDKNGVEIYTGYIVRWDLLIYEICFDCGFYMRDLSKIVPDIPITKGCKNASGGFEVLGSIYGSAKISKDKR